MQQTESEFQRTVIDLAHTFNWMVAHFRPAMTAHGWRTAVSADGKGFPDLVLVREKVIFAELKLDKATLSPEQAGWGQSLIVARANYYVWRPGNWDEIVEVLR